MDFFSPETLAEALAIKAERPDAVPIAGGTDVMVELNFDRRRPAALLDLTRCPELTTVVRKNGQVRLGAGVPYARITGELAAELPGLAKASRTVGSPQIRNRGTVGGNLGAASPAGDAHPPLLAAGAEIELTSVRGARLVPAADFYTGPKRSVIEPDELVTAIVQAPARGPQQFAKVGSRNAMVIAVCSFAVALDPPWSPLGGPSIGTGIGSAGPVPLRAYEAEDYANHALAPLWHDYAPLPAGAARRFGELAAQAARPIDDVRGSAAYRRHALAVLAARTFSWAWDEYLAGRPAA